MLRAVRGRPRGWPAAVRRAHRRAAQRASRRVGEGATSAAHPTDSGEPLGPQPGLSSTSRTGPTASPFIPPRPARSRYRPMSRPGHEPARPPPCEEGEHILPVRAEPPPGGHRSHQASTPTVAMVAPRWLRARPRWPSAPSSSAILTVRPHHDEHTAPSPRPELSRPRAIEYAIGCWAASARSSPPPRSVPRRRRPSKPTGRLSSPSASSPLYRIRLRADWAAHQPHMPWTPAPGGVDAEHR